MPLDNLLRGEFDENTIREDFRPSEMNAIRHVLEEREQRAALQRMLSGKRQPSGNFPEGRGQSRAKIGTIAGTSAGQPRGGKFPQQAEKGKSRDKVAKAAGTSARTMTKIREVCEAAEAEPEKYQPLVEEIDARSTKAPSGTRSRFAAFEPVSSSAKWLILLRQLEPSPQLVPTCFAPVAARWQHAG